MSTPKVVFTKYQVFVIAILAILQFTVVLDFMVLSPLSDTLIKELKIDAAKFSLVVSSYAFSAGCSGLLAAGFADKFDRKKLLLFFYTGFILGTLFCGLAPDYNSLLAARIITGIFGGVLSSISFAIITDLFPMEVRGRVMGFVQTAFAASQVLGIPVGLVLANAYGWHSPFIMIVALSLVVGALIIVKLKPVNEHLKLRTESNAFNHLIKTISNTNYLKGFMATCLLATGGFMLNQFGGAFSINNLKLTKEQLPILFGVTGVFSIIAGPLVGKLSDRVGKYKYFLLVLY
jgi:predicted MFS family arabinose efflux permease